jgi:hypothetical protein
MSVAGTVGAAGDGAAGSVPQPPALLFRQGAWLPSAVNVDDRLATHLRRRLPWFAGSVPAVGHGCEAAGCRFYF